MNQNKKPRRSKELPSPILALFEEDGDKNSLKDVISYHLETNKDPKEGGSPECMVAYQIKGTDGKDYDLEKDLTLDQLRVLCKKFGCNYVNNKNKFACRKSLFIINDFKNKMPEEGKSFISHFQTDVEDGIKRSSVEIDLTLESSARGDMSLSAQEKRAYNAISSLTDVAKSIAEQMKVTNRMANEFTLELRQTNKLLKQKNMITLASALGDKDLLERILGNMSYGSANETSSSSEEKND
jgi:hypothetical protein